MLQISLQILLLTCGGHNENCFWLLDCLPGSALNFFLTLHAHSKPGLHLALISSQVFQDLISIPCLLGYHTISEPEGTSRLQGAHHYLHCIILSYLENRQTYTLILQHEAEKHQMPATKVP